MVIILVENFVNLTAGVFCPNSSLIGAFGRSLSKRKVPKIDRLLFSFGRNAEGSDKNFLNSEAEAFQSNPQNKYIGCPYVGTDVPQLDRGCA
jgi:hypothetical protein